VSPFTGQRFSYTVVEAVDNGTYLHANPAPLRGAPDHDDEEDLPPEHD